MRFWWILGLVQGDVVSRFQVISWGRGGRRGVTEEVTENDAISPYSMTTTTRTTLGNIMLKQNNPFEAITSIQRELELRPYLAAAHDGLGWAYLS